jgi:hypothetical protein
VSSTISRDVGCPLLSGYRFEVDDREPCAGTHRLIQRAVDRDWVRQVVVHLAQEDCIAAARWQSGIVLLTHNNDKVPDVCPWAEVRILLSSSGLISVE